MTSGVASANKVLHLINGEHYAGAERVQDILCNNLPKFGYEAHLACLKPGMFPNQASIPHGRLHLFPMRSRMDLHVLQDISSLVKRERIACIHSHTPRTAMIGSLLSLFHDLPLVHHQHSPSTRETVQGLKDRVGAAMETLSVRRAARVIAVSSQIKDYCRTMGVPEDRIELVFNGVPGSPVPRSSENPASPLRVAVVALFRERKGIEVALEALARVQVPAELHVFGKFVSLDYKSRVHALTEQLNLKNRVHWHGNTTDIYEALSSMDAFVLPSLYGEGLPMVLLEAMAAGVPIFASDVEGVRDALPNSSYGTIFAAGNAGQLADAIVEYAMRPLPFLAAANAARVRQGELFSDVALAENIARVYDAVLSHAPKGANLPRGG